MGGSFLKAIGNAKARTLIILVLLVMGVAAVVVLLRSNNNDPLKTRESKTAQLPANIESVPGTTAVSQKYRDLQEEDNKRRAEAAKKDGKSAVATLIGISSGDKDKSLEDLLGNNKCGCSNSCASSCFKDPCEGIQFDTNRAKKLMEDMRQNPDTATDILKENPGLSCVMNKLDPKLVEDLLGKNPEFAKAFLKQNPQFGQQLALENPELAKKLMRQDPTLARILLEHNPDLARQFSETTGPRNPCDSVDFDRDKALALIEEMRNNPAAATRLLKENPGLACAMAELDPKFVEELMDKDPEFAKAFLKQNPAFAQQLMHDNPELFKRLVALDPQLAKTIFEQNPELARLFARDNPDLALKLMAQNPDLAKLFLKDNPELAKRLALENPELAMQILQKYPELAKILMKSNPALVKMLADRNPELAMKLMEQDPELAKTMLKAYPGLARVLAEKNPELALRLMQKDPQLAQQLLENAPSLAKYMAENHSELAAEMMQKSPEVTKLLLKAAPELAEYIAKHNPDLAAQLYKNSDFATALKTRNPQLAHLIQQQVELTAREEARHKQASPAVQAISSGGRPAVNTAVETQKQVDALILLMEGQSKAAMQAWNEVPAQQYAAGTLAAADSSKTKESKATDASLKAKGPLLIKAGSIVYAVLDTAVNTDEPGPVMATIVQGPLKGSKVMGSLQFGGRAEKVTLNFTTLSSTDFPKSFSISAVAVDPDTARTALASDVDHHYLLRYGSLFGSAFLSGYGQAIAQQGATSTVTPSATGAGNQVSTTNPQLSPEQQVFAGLGAVGQAWSSALGNNMSIPTTVKVDAGLGIGLLFLTDVSVPSSTSTSESNSVPLSTPIGTPAPTINTPASISTPKPMSSTPKPMNAATPS